jgi:hypothetical protein
MWYNSSWQYRVKVTVQSSKVDSSLSNFPVYVDLSDLPSGFFSNVKSDGADIRITSSDGETELPREVVSIDTTNKKGELHFKASSLSSTSNTDFYIYYGNSGASDYAVDATYGRNAVWSDYHRVYHLENNFTDASGNLNGTNYSSTDIAGKLGKGRDFSGGTSNQMVVIGAINKTSNFSIQVWVNPDVVNEDDQRLVGGSTTVSGHSFIGFRLTKAIISTWDGEWKNTAKSLSASTWQHLSLNFGVASAGSITLGTQVNGSSETTQTIAETTYGLNISGYNFGGRYVTYGTSFNGQMDEFRISKNVLTSSSATTTYKNQSSPSTFYSIGSEETSSSWYNSSWNYRVKVTVLASKVDADLTNYPVYVDLSGLPSGFHSHVKSDGGDIRVTKSDGTTEVPREVVFYDATNDKGELHFKGDVDSDTNTDFYIYYGNSGASDYAVDATYGAENVWSSDYEAVFHLQQDPSGTSPQIKDSTANGINGTTNGSMTSGNLISGKLAGYGLDLDDNDWVNFGDNCDFRTYDKTVSVWASSSDTDCYIIAKSKYGPGSGRWAIGNVTKPRGFVNLGGTDSEITSGSAIDSAWHLYTMVIDRDAYHRVYIDNSKVVENTGTNITDYSSSDLNTTNIMLLGGYNDPTGSTIHTSALKFVGKVDEIRIKKSVNSADWISTEYNNQSSPSTFYSIGSEETPSSSGSKVKAYISGSFVAKPLKVWNGTAWVSAKLKRYNGTAWVDV